MPVRAHPVIWILRAALVALPFTAGDAVAAASGGRSDAVRLCIAVIAWLVWAIALVASIVPHPVSLTAVRICAPALAAGAVWAAVDVRSALGIAGAVSALVAAFASTSSFVADGFIDGRSYGDERRFSLRAPAALLFGPIPLAWLFTVVGAVAGPLLLSARVWAVGAVALVAGWVLALGSVRSLHSLALRFVVFVPAGMTLVDPLILVDSELFARARIVRLGPALADSAAEDLTQNAPGLAIEVVSSEPVELTVKEGRGVAAPHVVSAVLFTPARPGALLDEAARRRISVG